jgi:hypothetical protein
MIKHWRGEGRGGNWRAYPIGFHRLPKGGRAVLRADQVLDQGELRTWSRRITAQAQSAWPPNVFFRRALAT